jgi:hypothetical protein
MLREGGVLRVLRVRGGGTYEGVVSSIRIVNSEILLYQDTLLRQITRLGWVRCIIWGSVKSLLEGMVHFFRIDSIILRTSMGLLWIGIFAPGLILFLATYRSAKLLKFSSPIVLFVVMEIIFLVTLAGQIPLFALGLYLPDGILTVFSIVLAMFAGYGAASDLRRRGWGSNNTNNPEANP